MPELPEVELVAKTLSKLVAGRRIRCASLLRQRLAPHCSPEEFASRLSGSQIEKISRRGKHILIDLDRGSTLIVHLRMSGKFLLTDAEIELPKFSHAVFELDGDQRLVFVDQRHFGFMRIVDSAAASNSQELAKLAPEPFSDEFSAQYLKDVLQNSSRSIKELLLDQTKVCGLGNIYAAEAMFLARINPLTPANRVSTAKTNRLFSSIRDVLREAVAFGETSKVDPENIDGSYFSGGFEDRWFVYDRENKPCPRCKTMIKRTKQAGRSSYFCPKCQRR